MTSLTKTNITKNFWSEYKAIIICVTVAIILITILLMCCFLKSCCAIPCCLADCAIVKPIKCCANL